MAMRSTLPNKSRVSLWAVVSIAVLILLVLNMSSLSNISYTPEEVKAQIQNLREAINYRVDTSPLLSTMGMNHVFDEDYVRLEGAYEEVVHNSKTWKFTFQSRPQAKILYYRPYQEPMSRHFYDWLESANAHPDLDVVIYGRGYEGWNNSLSVDVNLRATYGCDYFDLVVVHDLKNYEMPHLCGKSVYYYEVGDVKGPNYLKKLVSVADKVNIFSAKYGYIPLEMMDVRYPLIEEMKKYSSKEHAKAWAINPECANAGVFKPGPWEEKDSDIVLIGSLTKYQYPLRHHLSVGIGKGIIQNATVRKHPGYRMPVLDGMAPPPRRYDRSYYSETASVKQQDDYGIQLRKTKICLFDAMRLKIGIRKYAEALSSGCVIAADLPNEMEEIYRDVVIHISVEQSHEEINEILQAALKDEAELKRKAALGVLLARKYSNCGRKVEQMLFLMDEYNKGFRGYYFPYGWRMDCHGYTDVGAENPNPWCYENGMQPTIQQMLDAKVSKS